MDTDEAVELGERPKAEALTAALGALEGKRIIDIGCGEGLIARALAERGATVQGYDPFIDETGWIDAGAGSYRLSRASADALPEPDASADVVLFVFSLHHVPRARLPGALTEARRVLRPGGRLCVAEPLAEGPAQYVMEPYHDETAVRATALAALSAHARPAFDQERLLYFSESRRFLDFDAYARQAIGNMRYNGYTEAEVLDPEVRRRFNAMAAAHGGSFEQRVRINLFA